MENDIYVEELARPYRAFIDVPKTKVKELFDAEWEANSDVIIKASGYKGKKSKGGVVDKVKARKSLEANLGVNALYKHALVNYACDRIKEGTGNSVLLTNNIYLKETDDEAVIVFNYYYQPKIIFKDELNWVCEENYYSDMETEYVNRCKDLQFKHRKFELCSEDHEITDEDEVVIDIFASIDGESYEYGTIKLQRMVVGDLTSPEIIKALVGAKKGQLLNITYPNPLVDGENTGKTVEAQIMIYEVYSLSFFDIDGDELYQCENLGGKEEFKAKFEEEYNNYIRNRRSQEVVNHVLDQVVAKGEIEPLPQAYIDTAAMSFVNQHYDRFKGDKEAAYKAAQVKTEQELGSIFANQIIKDMIQKMAINWYIETYELNPDLDMQSIIDDMLERVSWVTKPAVKALS